MNKPLIRVPVVCPECRQEVLASLEVADISAALIAKERIRLHASCHGVSWEANPYEEEQLREYLGIILPQGQSG